MSIQSINDEWWVYIFMDPHYSNNIFVYGTTHETGHKQPKFVSSELHLSKKCPHNKSHPNDTLPMSYI